MTFFNLQKKKTPKVTKIALNYCNKFSYKEYVDLSVIETVYIILRLANRYGGSKHISIFVPDNEREKFKEEIQKIKCKSHVVVEPVNRYGDMYTVDIDPILWKR
jgi:hypothetical protein